MLGRFFPEYKVHHFVVELYFANSEMILTLRKVHCTAY